MDTFYPVCGLSVQDLHSWFCISLLPYLFWQVVWLFSSKNKREKKTHSFDGRFRVFSSESGIEQKGRYGLIQARVQVSGFGTGKWRKVAKSGLDLGVLQNATLTP